MEFAFRIEEFETLLKQLEKRVDNYEAATEVDLPEGTVETKDVLEAIKNFQIGFQSKVVDKADLREIEKQISDL